jgi:hypothetical protein
VQGNWTILIWVVVAAVGVWLLQRWLHQHIHGLVLLLSGNDNLAIVVHFALLMPGVVVHEAAHWVMARLLGVKVSSFSVGPQRVRGGQLRLGSVQIRRADPVRESLIGLAPLLVGTTLVLLLARWGFGLLPDEKLALADWPRRIWTCVRAPDAWLWVYLIFTVSNAMMPSASDRRPLRVLLLYLVLVLAIAYLLVGIPRNTGVWLAWGLRLLAYLAYAFTLTAAIDVAVLAPLLLLEWIAGRLTGRRVEYR